MPAYGGNTMAHEPISWSVNRYIGQTTQNTHEDILCFLSDNSCLPFRVEMAGISYCDGSYHIQRDKSIYCVLEYIVSGSGVLHFNGETYYPKTGDIYILPLGTSHDYYSSKEEPWIKLFVNLNRNINLFLDQYGLTGQILFPNMQHMYPMFQELYTISRLKIEPWLVMEQMYLKTHQILMRLAQSANLPADIPLEVLKMRDYIDSRIDGSFTIDELSTSIYRSNDYVIKMFKKYFHTTPHAYFLQQKMNKAKMFLKETQLSVSDIAEALGYESPQYFSKNFKHITGMTPNQYRAQ